MQKFITCDRLRSTQDGENFWQNMIKNKVKISERQFLKHIKISQVLDEGESWKDYKENARREGDPIKFYKSSGAYFFQRAGFEFIWIKK